MRMAYTVKMQLFGPFRKFGNGMSMDVEIDRPVTVIELKRNLAEKLRSLDPQSREAELVSDSAIASETHVLSENVVIDTDCSLAILPPVSGG